MFFSLVSKLFHVNRLSKLLYFSSLLLLGIKEQTLVHDQEQSGTVPLYHAVGRALQLISETGKNMIIFYQG